MEGNLFLFGMVVSALDMFDFVPKKEHPYLNSMNGKDYAKVGDRLYTRHAVARMQPSGVRYSNASAGGNVRASRIIEAGEIDYGRSVSPNYVEDVIRTGFKTKNIVDGVERTLYTSSSVKVVTEQNSKLIITVLTQ